jgi:predicted RNA-binding protein with PUA domain
MKIAVCGSMTVSKKMIEAEKELIKLGHSVVLPEFTKEYTELESSDKIHSESVKNKINYDLIRKYFDKIKAVDAILIINETRHNIENYIGGNSFLEAGFAHILNKKIFLLNVLPNMIYTDEIIAMKPIAINGDFSKIV